MRRALRVAMAALLFLLAGISTAVAGPLAATSGVNIQNFAFAPASVTINAGDSVRWTNLDGVPHSARSVNDAFNTGTLNLGQSGTVTFNTAGTFDYICGIHGASMSGTVIVRSLATPTPAPSTPRPSTPTPTPAPPTPVPTTAPTPQPSAAATAPSAAPSSATSAPQATTAAPRTSATVAVASTAPAAALNTASSGDAGPGPVFVAVGAVIVAGLLGLAVVLARRT